MKRVQRMAPLTPREFEILVEHEGNIIKIKREGFAMSRIAMHKTSRGWNVTHLRTGRAVVKHLTQESAKKAVQRLDGMTEFDAISDDAKDVPAGLAERVKAAIRGLSSEARFGCVD